VASTYITGVDDGWGWLRGLPASHKAEDVPVGAELCWRGEGNVFGEGAVDESGEDCEINVLEGRAAQ